MNNKNTPNSAKVISIGTGLMDYPDRKQNFNSLGKRIENYFSKNGAFLIEVIEEGGENPSRTPYSNYAEHIFYLFENSSIIFSKYGKYGRIENFYLGKLSLKIASEQSYPDLIERILTISPQLEIIKE